MAKLSQLFQNETGKENNQPKNITLKKIHYSKLNTNEAQYRDELRSENILPIAESIRSVGILQPLKVTPSKGKAGFYDIVSGHTRCAAVRYLVEERGLSGEFEYLPCEVKIYESPVEEELELLSSNFHSTESPQEQARRVQRLYDIYQSHPEYLHGSSLRETLQRILNLSKTGVGEFITLNHNLSETAHEQFEQGKISKRTAVELASLDEAEQNQLLYESKETGLKLDDVKAYKAGKKQTEASEEPKTDTAMRYEKTESIDAEVRHQETPEPFSQVTEVENVLDTSPASAGLLVERYKEKLTHMIQQKVPTEEMAEMMLIIMALDFYYKNA